MPDMRCGKCGKSVLDDVECCVYCRPVDASKIVRGVLLDEYAYEGASIFDRIQAVRFEK